MPADIYKAVRDAIAWTNETPDPFMRRSIMLGVKRLTAALMRETGDPGMSVLLDEANTPAPPTRRLPERSRSQVKVVAPVQYGWITREGEVFPCEFAEHDRICYEQGLADGPRTAELLGWCRVNYTGYQCLFKLSPKQVSALRHEFDLKPNWVYEKQAKEYVEPLVQTA